jgi:gamma-glutamyltranspeptidase/glutathione hydrolase
LLWLVAAAAVTSCATSTPAQSPGPADQAFVVAANPLAAEAGMNVLRRGGSAVDAAIAVQAMLSLVEPQSSGLGGGAFLHYYDAGSRALTVYDGREVAPAGATPDMFLDDSGNPLSFRQAVLGGRATGVPGAVALLQLAHRERGRLAWNTLFADTERTAREGFIVSCPRPMYALISRSPTVPWSRPATASAIPLMPNSCPVSPRRARMPCIGARRRRGSSSARAPARSAGR